MTRKTTVQDVVELPIEARICVLRGHKVILDSDLADLYGVPVKVLIQSVKRNLTRFPSDFMFVLIDQELAILRSQFVTSRLGKAANWGGRRYAPFAFSEQGVAMLSSVLRRGRAITIRCYFAPRSISASTKSRRSRSRRKSS
ncbi:MAG: ORF6N domain-containing protein [Burkholderiales bacterium]